MIILILKAIVIGFFASVGLGPVTVLVLKRGLSSGFASAFISGLGCAFADAFYGTLAFIGAGYAIQALESYEGYIRLGIMVLLFGLAFYLWTLKNRNGIDLKDNPRKAYAANFFSTFSLGLSNPFLILVYLTIFSVLPLVDNETQLHVWPMTTIGLLLGTSLWWFAISYLTGVFKTRLPVFLSGNINRISGAMLFSLGLFSGISGLLIILQSA